jgi:hypothetical protein
MRVGRMRSMTILVRRIRIRMRNNYVKGIMWHSTSFRLHRWSQVFASQPSSVLYCGVKGKTRESFQAKLELLSEPHESPCVQHLMNF